MPLIGDHSLPLRSRRLAVRVAIATARGGVGGLRPQPNILRGPAKSLGIGPSRRCPDPWSDLARLSS
jgi:hypothetical protein